LSVKFSSVLLLPTVLLALLLARRLKRLRLRRVACDALLVAGLAIGLLHLAYIAANLDYSSEAGRATIRDYTRGRGTLAVDETLGGAEAGLLALERFDPYLAQWLTGLLAVNAHNTVGVYFSFAFGEVSSAGRWWYHPAVFLVKTPLAMFAAALVGLALWARRRQRAGSSRGSRRPGILARLCLLTVVVYLGVAITSSYNLGFRHLLPVLPFLYLPVARAVAAYRVGTAVLLLVLASESLAVTPLWASQTNTWWLGKRNPTRFSLSHGNLDFGQNYLQLARAVERRGLGSIGVLVPSLRPTILSAYLNDARLVRPGDSLPAGWYAVGVLIEQLVPAVLREDVGYVFRLESLRERARRWQALWRQVAAGEDHGYVAGTFHLYRLAEDRPAGSADVAQSAQSALHLRIGSAHTDRLEIRRPAVQQRPQPRSDRGPSGAHVALFGRVCCEIHQPLRIPAVDLRRADQLEPGCACRDEPGAFRRPAPPGRAQLLEHLRALAGQIDEELGVRLAVVQAEDTGLGTLRLAEGVTGAVQTDAATASPGDQAVRRLRVHGGRTLGEHHPPAGAGRPHRSP
jgi:hypothetical protein